MAQPCGAQPQGEHVISPSQTGPSSGVSLMAAGELGDCIALFTAVQTTAPGNSHSPAPTGARSPKGLLGTMTHLPT